MAPLLGVVGVLSVILSISAPAANAAASTYLNFQARLLTSSGGIVPDGTYNIDFKIYDQDSTTGSVGTCSGHCLWEETRKNSNSQGVTVVNGYFSVNLGSVTAFPTINWDQQLWLTMNIGGTSSGASPTWDGEMLNAGNHAILLTAIPYSFIAGQLALTSGANRGILSFGSVTNNPVITLPNASGTVCLQAATACGFESTTGTDFIRNQTSTQTANFNIQSAASGSVAAIIQGAAGQSADLLDIKTSTPATVFSVNASGSLLSKNSSDSTAAFQIQNASGGNLLNVDTTNSIITLAGNNSGEVSAWSTASNTLPNVRDVHGSVVANGYVYVIGGTNGSTYQSTVYYAKLNADGSVGSWNTAANALPAARGYLSTVTANGYVYVIGGFDSGGTAQSTVYYAKLNADGSVGSWNTASNALPAARDAQGSVVANGYVYVIGGFDSGGTAQATVYYAKLNADGSVGTWSTAANSITAARAAFGSVVANGYVYVLGGYNGSAQSTVYYAKLNADGSVGSWNTAANALPAARYYPSSVVSGGYVYLLGGSNSGGIATSTVYYAKLNADGSVGSWNTTANAITAARGHHSSVTSNGYIYTLAGDDSGGSATSTVYYSSTSRVQIGANLDLVGLQGQTLADSGGNSLGTTGGSITAGNITAVGDLQVQGQGSFAQGVAVLGSFTDNGSALFQNSTNSTTSFQVQNSNSNPLLNVDTSTTVNLITNPGFEVNTTGWSARVSATLSTTSSHQVQGNKSLDVATAASNGSGTQYNLNYQASQTYYLSFYAKMSSGSISTFEFGRSNDTGASDTSCATGQTLNTGWQRFTCSWAVGGSPSGTNYIYFIQTDNGSGRHILIDAVQLENTNTSATQTAFSPGGALQLLGLVDSPLAIRTLQDSPNVFQVQNSSGSNFIQVDTAGNTLNLGNGGINTTVQIGTTTGAVSQTINLGTNATSGAVNNIRIGNASTSTNSVIIGTNSNAANTVTIDAGTGAGSIAIGNSASAHNIAIGAGAGANNLTLNLGTGVTGGSNTASVTLGSNNAAASITTIQGGNGTGASAAVQIVPQAAGDILIGGASATGQITVGSSSSANNVLVANGSGASAVSIANVQNGGSVSIGAGMTTGTISLGGTATTGTITVGAATTASTSTVNISSANGTNSTQTVNIAAGSSTTSGGKVVNIATGVPGTSTTNAVHIGDGGTTTGTVGVTIGSIGAAGHTTLIQGGNGATAVSIQAASSGTILVGSTNNNTITIGGTGTTNQITLGQGTSSNTISIGSNIGGGQTQTINIGTGSTGTGTIAIGNTNAGIVTLQSAGGVVITGGTTKFGQSTGFASGEGSKIITSANASNDTSFDLQVYRGGSYTSRFNISTSGQVAIKPDTSTTAFSVQDTNSHNYILADTSGANLSLGDIGIASGIQIGNTTGAVAQTISIGTNSTGSSSSTVNVGSTVAGLTTVQSASGLAISSLGTTNSVTYLCRNASNIVAACQTNANGSAFVQGGNSFGATAVLGTNDSNSLQVRTGGNTQATIANGGATTFKNSTDSSGAFTVQDQNSHQLFNVDTAGANVNIGATGSLALATTVNIANSSANNTQTVNIGHTGSAGNAVLIQGGTGASAISLQAASGGGIVLGTTNNNAISIGGANTTSQITIGQATGSNSNTIAIGSSIGNSGTQTINIGTSSTGGSTTNVNLGSTIAGTVAVQGPETITGRTSGTATNFTITNGSSGQIGQVIKGASSQTADLFQTQDSTGAYVHRQDVNGDLDQLGYITNPSGGFGQYVNNLNATEDFTNTTYWKYSSVTTPTANTVTAPDGNATAESLADSGAGGSACQFDPTGTAAANTTFTFSVWLKTSSGTVNPQLRIDGGPTSCATGATVTGTAASFTATTTWQRFSVTQAIGTCASCSAKVFILPAGAGSGTVSAWGAQLVVGSLPGVYTYNNGNTPQTSGEGLVVNGTALFAAGANSSTAFQVQDTTGNNYLNIDTAGAVVTIGRITGSGTETVNVGISTTATTNVIHIGDAASATDTITIGSASNSASSLTLESGTGTTALFNGATQHTIQLATGAAVQSVTIGSTNSTSATTIQAGANGSNETLQLQVGNNGVIGIGTSNVAKTLNLGAVGSTVQTTTVHIADTTGNATQAVTIGSVSSASNAVTLQGGTGSGAISIQTGASGTIGIGNSGVANTIQIGNSNNNANQTIGIGNNTNSSAVNTITIGSTSSTSSLTLQGGNNSSTAIALLTGNNGTTAGGITIGNTTGAFTQSINIGTNATSGATNTLHIGDAATAIDNVTIGSNSNSANTLSLDAGTGASSIAIGNSASGHNIAIGAGSGSNNVTVNIGSGVSGGSNTATLTIGSNNSAASVTTIQGGVNGANETLQLQVASSGVIGIGTANVAKTINVGAVGSTAQATTIHIADTTGWDPLESTCRHASLSIL